MADPGQPLDDDEVPLVMQVLVENLHRVDKIVVADARRNLAAARRSKKHGRKTPATITLKTSNQVVDSVKGPPEDAVAYVLMVGISAELVDDARRARDEAARDEAARDEAARVRMGPDGRTEGGLVVDPRHLKAN